MWTAELSVLSCLAPPGQPGLGRVELVRQDPEDASVSFNIQLDHPLHFVYASGAPPSPQVCMPAAVCESLRLEGGILSRRTQVIR